VSIRPVKRVAQSRPTLEGAGVHLRRAFGFGDPKEFDPFLLFDDFRNDVPSEYLAGFPWHPHRGIETITYVLAGSVDHGDSLGNRGTLSGGDVQWMTAGSGIIHQEMPKGDDHGRMHGFQLWANLPSSLKMTTPRYQDVAGKDIPEVIDELCVELRADDPIDLPHCSCTPIGTSCFFARITVSFSRFVGVSTVFFFRDPQQLPIRASCSRLTGELEENEDEPERVCGLRLGVEGERVFR